MSNLESNLQDLLAMLSKGQFVEAMEKYLHDDVTLREASGEPKHGKAFCIAFEKEVLANVAEFVRYDVHAHAVNGDATFYEGTMEYVEKDGTRVTVEQAVVSRWEGDQIVSERFYHA